MGSKVLLFVSLVVFCIRLGIYEIQARSAPPREVVELQEKPMFPNKQPIMSFKDEGGAVYDCVRIYEQPALDHPLLKNHKIQMKPTSIPEQFASEVSIKGKEIMSMLKSTGCPKGTMPIRRIHKEDLIRVKAFTESYSNASLNENRPDDKHAVVQKLNSRSMFYGTQVNMNILNPKVDDDQASIAVTSIWVGAEKDANIIQAGWAVAPGLYGDHSTRFITYWRGVSGGCFNTFCPGFVQVDKNFPVDRLLNSSIYHQRPFEMQVQVTQDRNTLNWWLVLPTLYVKVGYWPVSLLPRLHNGAPNIAWGAYARPSPASGISPPMGFGTFPDKSNIENSGYFTKVLIENEKGSTCADWTWESVSSNWDCYGARFDYDEIWHEFSVSYGGPGGKC